jgi:hypothetical protein
VSTTTERINRLPDHESRNKSAVQGTQERKSMQIGKT